MILTPVELEELTGKKYCNAQVRVLRCLGIESRPRPDGSLVVSRSNVDLALGSVPSKVKINEPNWGAV